MSNLFLLNHIRIAWTEVVQNERDLYDGLVNIAAQKNLFPLYIMPLKLHINNI